MANTKSEKKSMRQNLKRRMRNKSVRTALKTYVGKAEDQIADNADTTQQAVLVAISHLDKAATKGVIHPNQAARRKSRLMKKLNQAVAAGA